jgi:hypothetical protein
MEDGGIRGDWRKGGRGEAQGGKSGKEGGAEGPSVRKRTVRNVNTDKIPAISVERT